MALTQAQRDEVVDLINKLPCIEHGAELTRAIDALEESKSEMVGYREAVQTLIKVSERLSIVVVGDEEFNIPGLGQRLQNEERARLALAEEVHKRWQKEDARVQSGNVSKAKLIGFIFGSITMLQIILRVVEHFIARYMPSVGAGP